MEEYDDLDSYNGNTEHDMWVDFDHYEITGAPDVFEDDILNNFIDSLNDCD